MEMAQTGEVREKWFDGLGGWLIVPLLLLLVSTFVSVSNAMKWFRLHSPKADFHAMAGHPLFITVAGIVVVLAVVRFVVGLLSLVQYLRKKRSLPRLFQAWFILGIAVIVIVAIQYALAPDLFTTINPNLTPGAIRFWSTVGIFECGILYLYFDLSKKVKTVFVR